MVVQQGTSLTGEVIMEGKEGRPVERARVQIEKKGTVVAEIFSEQNGRFSVTDLPGGEFDLVVSKGEQFITYRFSEEKNGLLLNMANFPGGRG